MAHANETKRAARLPDANAAAAAIGRYQMNHGLFSPPVATMPMLTAMTSIDIQIGLRTRRSYPRRNSSWKTSADVQPSSHITAPIQIETGKTLSHAPMSPVNAPAE